MRPGLFVPPPSHAASHPLPLERAGVRGVVIPSTARNLAVAFELCFLCHPRPDRGSSVVVFVFCLRTRAISWRHLSACAWLRPSPELCLGGEDCLSEALILSNAKELSINNRPPGKADSFLRQAQDRREILRFAQDKPGMTTERHRIGPRPSAHGFGSFCRNKRTSACGAELPQEDPPSL